jgi:putative oxidoreductase|tara:strand:+ start:1158 stop:1541 length:384 start_codon:yes stop_codon:yes gene_type:complete
MRIIEIIGRIFLSAVFLIAGVNKIFNYEGTAAYMESFGVPDFLYIPAIILEILFPLLIIIGYQTKISALIMAIFSISLAIIFHTDFSNQMQVMSFLKNFAIAGGFIIIFVNGPSRWSIDYMLKSKTK